MACDAGGCRRGGRDGHGHIGFHCARAIVAGGLRRRGARRAHAGVALGAYGRGTLDRAGQFRGRGVGRVGRAAGARAGAGGPGHRGGRSAGRYADQRRLLGAVGDVPQDAGRLLGAGHQPPVGRVRRGARRDGLHGSDPRPAALVGLARRRSHQVTAAPHRLRSATRVSHFTRRPVGAALYHRLDMLPRRSRDRQTHRLGYGLAVRGGRDHQRASGDLGAHRRRHLGVAIVGNRSKPTSAANPPRGCDEGGELALRLLGPVRGGNLRGG